MQVLDINQIQAIEYLIVCYLPKVDFIGIFVGFSFSCLFANVIKPLHSLIPVAMKFHDMSSHLFHPKIFLTTGIAFIRLTIPMYDLLMLHKLFDFSEGSPTLLALIFFKKQICSLQTPLVFGTDNSWIFPNWLIFQEFRP